MALTGLVNVYKDGDLKTAMKNIKCPIHHTLKPGLLPFQAYEIEPNPFTKHLSNEACKEFKIRKWKYKRDRFGNKIPNFKNHYQPEVSALYLREKVYTPNHPVCRACRKCHQ